MSISTSKSKTYHKTRIVNNKLIKTLILLKIHKYVQVKDVQIGTKSCEYFV